jgi:hypothetical protein
MFVFTKVSSINQSLARCPRSRITIKPVAFKYDNAPNVATLQRKVLKVGAQFFVNFP